jgi:hypothetical protein
VGRGAAPAQQRSMLDAVLVETPPDQEVTA